MICTCICHILGRSALVSFLWSPSTLVSHALLVSDEVHSHEYGMQKTMLPALKYQSFFSFFCMVSAATIVDEAWYCILRTGDLSRSVFRGKCGLLIVHGCRHINTDYWIITMTAHRCTKKSYLHTSSAMFIILTGRRMGIIF